jgi:hypothetical protein
VTGTRWLSRLSFMALLFSSCIAGKPLTTGTSKPEIPADTALLLKNLDLIGG